MEGVDLLELGIDPSVGAGEGELIALEDPAVEDTVADIAGPRGLRAVELARATVQQQGSWDPVHHIALHYGVEPDVADLAVAGEPVEAPKWMTGDVLFFHGDQGSATHLALYIGEGNFIHTDAPGASIKISSIEDYRNDYATARRLT